MILTEVYGLDEELYNSRQKLSKNRQAVEQRKGARDSLVILQKMEGEHMHQTL